MPSRYNEFYANLKQDLRYCVKHERYYNVKFGCQLCYLIDNEKVALTLPQVPVYQCPTCEQMSLFWNAEFYRYECLNKACQVIITKSDIKK